MSGWARVPPGLSDSDVALDTDTWLSSCADGRQPREPSAWITRNRASVETSVWPRDMEPHHSCPVSDLSLVSMARKLSLCKGRARLLSPLSLSCSPSLKTNSLGGAALSGRSMLPPWFSHRGARPKRQLLDENALKVELRSPAPPLLAGLPSKADAQGKLKSPSQARTESKMHDSYNFSREILRKLPGLSTPDSPHLGIAATHPRIDKAHLQWTAGAKSIPAGNEVLRREKRKVSLFAGDGERCHLGLYVCMYGYLYCTSEWHRPIPLWNPLPHVTALLLASILRE